MIKKFKRTLYNISRLTGKASSILADVEAVASLDSKKIKKRLGNKVKNKMLYKTANKIGRRLNKF